LNNLVSLASIVLTGVLLLLISIFHNVYAVTNVNSFHFSIEVPNDWVYRENFLNESNIVLTLNEFADLLIAENASASLLDVIEHGALVELGKDQDFHIENASLEKYVKYFLSFAQNYDPKYENTSVGGERAIKVFINGTDVGRTSAMKNITSGINSISYLVVHQDQPYYLYYIANANDYNKYLPYFEQIVKTFRFVK
jgi:hypothetical protein